MHCGKWVRDEIAVLYGALILNLEDTDALTWKFVSDQISLLFVLNWITVQMFCHQQVKTTNELSNKHCIKLVQVITSGLQSWTCKRTHVLINTGDVILLIYKNHLFEHRHEKFHRKPNSQQRMKINFCGTKVEV